MKKVGLSSPTDTVNVLGAGAQAKTVNSTIIINTNSSVCPSSDSQPLPPTWNLPQQLNTFTGRDDLLSELYKQMSNREHSQFGIVAVNGLGGIGKTQLALKYAHENKLDYRLRVWFSAETRDQLDMDYRNFWNTGYNLSAEGFKRKLDAEDSEKVVRETVKGYFENSTNWLLIYDNVNNYSVVNDYLPVLSETTLQKHTLLTSRRTDFPQKVKTINVDVMSSKEAIQLLINLTNYTADDEAMCSLAEKLGYLPLALAQAGAYMKTNISVQEYLRLYESTQYLLLKDASLPSGASHDPVAVTWGISLEMIEKEEKKEGSQLGLARSLLAILSYLSPDQIPHELVKECLCNLYPKTNEVIINKAFTRLKNYSLIKLDEKKISVHRLVQDIMRYHYQHSGSVGYTSNDSRSNVENESQLRIKQEIKMITAIMSGFQRFKITFREAQIHSGARYVEEIALSLDRLRTTLYKEKIDPKYYSSEYIECIYQLYIWLAQWFYIHSQKERMKDVLNEFLTFMDQCTVKEYERPLDYAKRMFRILDDLDGLGILEQSAEGAYIEMRRLFIDKDKFLVFWGYISAIYAIEYLVEIKNIESLRWWSVFFKFLGFHPDDRRDFGKSPKDEKLIKINRIIEGVCTLNRVASFLNWSKVFLINISNNLNLLLGVLYDVRGKRYAELKHFDRAFLDIEKAIDLKREHYKLSKELVNPGYHGENHYQVAMSYDSLGICSLNSMDYCQQRNAVSHFIKAFEIYQRHFYSKFEFSKKRAILLIKITIALLKEGTGVSVDEELLRRLKNIISKVQERFPEKSTNPPNPEENPVVSKLVEVIKPKIIDGVKSIDDEESIDYLEKAESILKNPSGFKNMLVEEKIYHSLQPNEYRDNYIGIFKTPLKAPLPIDLPGSIRHYGYTCEDVPGDGNCFYHAVAAQLNQQLGNSISHEGLRNRVTAHAKVNIVTYGEFDCDAHLPNLGRSGVWAEHIDIVAISRIYHLNIIIVRSDGRVHIIKRDSPQGTISLGYEVGIHYTSLQANSQTNIERLLQGGNDNVCIEEDNTQLNANGEIIINNVTSNVLLN